MYIIGKANKPNTYESFDNDADAFLKLGQLLYYDDPKPERVFVQLLLTDGPVFCVGVHNKPDMECFFTTEEEAERQKSRYLGYFSSREIYSLKFLGETTNG